MLEGLRKCIFADVLPFPFLPPPISSSYTIVRLSSIKAIIEEGRGGKGMIRIDR